MKLLDLFSGIGGFHLGLTMGGINIEKCYWSEIDKYASKVYRKRFPEAIELGDVTKITGEGLGPIDIICGGFPCQDISVAGKQAGIEEGKRSSLFMEVIRLGGALSPRVIYLENVTNLLSINGGRDFGIVLRELASIGYNAEWHCVPASHVGAPHRRVRTWIVANSNGIGWDKLDDATEAKCETFFESCKRQGWNDEEYLSFYEQRFEPKTDGIQARNDDGLSEGMDRLRCLGNAVVPQVVAFITRNIILPRLKYNPSP